MLSPIGLNNSIDDDTVLTAKQIKDLQKRNAQLEEENLILKKNHCNIHSTLRQRLIAVQILSHEHHISTLCRVLRVNRSTYYKFLNHTPSARDKDNAYIRSCIIAKSCRSFFLFMRYS